MKNYLLIVVGIILCNMIYAQPTPDYYKSAESLNGQELKTALFDIIKSSSAVSYKQLWNKFSLTDAKPDGTVWDMYSDTPNETPPYVYKFSDDQCGNYKIEGDCYNREHSFPASWFNDEKPMYTDLFHIYPTDGYVNSKRSNYPFGEVDRLNIIWKSENGSLLGMREGSTTDIVFEPIDEYKGDFARTYFYMATRYQNLIGSWKNNTSSTEIILDGSTYIVFEEWYLDILLKWHKEDAVSEKEIKRNNEIFKIQHSRNPFIDSTQFVSRIWGD